MGMRALLAGVAAAGLVAAGATTAAAGTVSRPYTVTVQRGHVKTTYRCVRSPVRSTWRRADCIPVLRPRVTLDAARVALNGFTGGTGINQQDTSWFFRVLQAGTPGILAIDNQYTAQGYRYVGSGTWVEIQLGAHGGAYQGDCLTWNAGLVEYDAIGCQNLVSQHFTWLNYDTGDGTANFENQYTKTCMQADDASGEGTAIQNATCGSRNNTVWFWDALVQF